MQTDASGTLEAVKAALSTLPQDSVLLRFLLNTASQITVSDVDLALASQAIILGFNTELTDEVQAAAREKGALLCPARFHLSHVIFPTKWCHLQRTS